MDNYESRLYAIALRAPITTYHTEKVEDDLCTKVKSKRKAERELMNRLYSFTVDKGYKQPLISQSPELDLTFVKFSLDYLPWIGSKRWLRMDEGIEHIILKHSLTAFQVAVAAIEYAKTTINTPHEVVVLSLPVNEDISRAILGMEQFKELANDYLQKEINEEEAFAKMDEFLQKLAPYEYKKEPVVSAEEALEKEETLVTNFDVPNKVVETEEEPSFFAKVVVVVGIICAIIAIMSLL